MKSVQGKIIKGIAGFYYVACEGEIYSCKAKGAFRNQKIKPLVGDDVLFDITDKEKQIGNIVELLPRKIPSFVLLSVMSIKLWLS